MPYVRKSRKRIVRRRRVRRGRRGGRRLRGVVRPVKLVGGNQSVVPNSIYTKLKAHTGDVGGTTSIALAYKLWPLNSIYDMDGSGLQPRGHDQWATLYDRYLVVGSHVRATFACYTAGAQVRCGINPITSLSFATPNTTMKGMMESRGVRTAFLTPDKPVVVNYFFKPWITEGIRKSQYYIDEEYRGALNVNNPAAGPIGCQTFFQSLNELSSVTVTCILEITQYVLLDMPNLLQSS